MGCFRKVQRVSYGINAFEDLEDTWSNPVAEHEPDDSDYQIVIDCPICFMYGADYRDILGHGTLLEIDLPYVADNWSETETVRGSQPVIQLTEKHPIIPTTIEVNGTRTNVVSRDAPTRHRTDYTTQLDEFIMFFSMNGQFDTVHALVTHVEASHSHIMSCWGDGGTDELCGDDLLPIGRASYFQYLELARMTEEEGAASPFAINFSDPFKTNELIIGIIYGTLFTNAQTYEAPFTSQMQRGLNNIITIRNLFTLL